MSPYELAADLPPPRDDEPASLRRDIADELADHLECALRRELLASGGRQSPDGGGLSGRRETASESADSSFRTAQQSVLARFGNPAAVARKLWLEAMQEKLMAQKITILLASVATAAMVALSALMWQAQQRATDAQRAASEAQAALLQQHEQFSASILKTLESLRTPPLAAAAAASTVDGWSPLTVKLVSEDGKAVEGEVSITGTPFGGDKPDINLTRNSAGEGVADFGMVPFGNYSMTVEAIAAGEKYHESFMVAPGRASEHNIVCPTAAPPEVTMQFTFNPPKKLNANDLQYLVALSVKPRQVTGRKWWWSNGPHLILCVDAAGQVTSTAAVSGGFAVDAGRGQFDMQSLSLAEAPKLREYVYQLTDVRPFAPAHGYDPPVNLGLAGVDLWFPKLDNFVPKQALPDLQPRGGADNTYHIDITDDYWDALFKLFRKSPYTQDATIPAGMQVVEVEIDPTISPSLMSWFSGSGRRRFSQSAGQAVDITFAKPASPDGDDENSSSKILIRSAELIAVPDQQALQQSLLQGRFGQPSGSRGATIRNQGAPVQISVLVSNEQADAIRLAQTKGRVGIQPSESVLATPTLDQAVLEELQSLPDKES